MYSVGGRYHRPMKSSQSLPLDGQRILELAARSMFDLFANASEGMLLAVQGQRGIGLHGQMVASREIRLPFAPS